MVVFSVWQPPISASGDPEGYLTVRFLDVGQGDSVHIVTPDGYELLIDGGPSASVLRELSKGRLFFDKKIDVVIATHPDTDHVGGLVDVLKRFDVDWLLETESKSDSSAAVAYSDVVSIENARKILAQSGQVLQLGASTTVQILSPYGDTTQWKSNSASIVVRVVYGETEFMLTGDAPSEIEDYLVGLYGSSLQSDVLKLGHHGSKTSTSELFLDNVQPLFAVVSAGANNRYRHPNVDVIKKVMDREIQVVSTIESGTITFKSDGVNVWVSE